MSARPQKAERGSRHEGTVEKIVSGGAGLVRLERGAALVPRVAPGERIVLEEGRPFARLLKVLAPSTHRVAPACTYAARCGGCDLLHLDAEAQREARLSILGEALTGIPTPPMVYRTASPEQRGRTRVRLHARRVGREVMVGYHALGTQTIVPVEICLAIDPRLEAAFLLARQLLADATGTGEIQAALGHGEKPVLSIAWHGALPPSCFGVAERLVNEGRLAGVSLWLDGAREPARIGDPRPVSIDVHGAELVAPVGGFAQASDVGDRVLVDRVVALARCDGLRVVELHAGSGNLTCALARSAAHVTAVELSTAACTTLRENIAARDLTAHVKVIEGDADRHELPGNVDVVVLDPPRTGARGAVAELLRKRPRRVVYVSCDPATLGRDLRALMGAYMVEAVEAVDLFPGTSHVETVVACVRS